MSNIGGKSHSPGGVGNYKAPGHTSSTPRPVYKRTDSTGVGDGLSKLAKFDSEEHGPMYNYMVDPITGNAPERQEPVESDSASSKGLSFKIC